MRRPIQMLGFSLAGFLCVALAVLKLTSEVHWSWWRVLLPLWLVLGHNILCVTVGFVWIYLAEHGAKGEEATVRQDHDPSGYQLGAMLCFLIFLDNLLKQIEGPRDTVWFGFSSGRWGLIWVFGVLSVLCQRHCQLERTRNILLRSSQWFPLISARGHCSPDRKGSQSQESVVLGAD